MDAENGGVCILSTSIPALGFNVGIYYIVHLYAGDCQRRKKSHGATY